MSDDTKTKDVQEQTEQTWQAMGADHSANAVYHEETNSWIRPAQNPYTLENFQRAYDNLSSGKSARVRSASVSKKYPRMRLSATHHSVKIFPKTEEEQREIELMKDVTVSYIPFDYEQLPESETKYMQFTGSQPTFPKETRYTVTYDDSETTEGGPAGQITVALPVL